MARIRVAISISWPYSTTTRRMMQDRKRDKNKQSKRPFTKGDLVAVLKSATKPLKKEQGEKESEETSESHRHDDST